MTSTPPPTTHRISDTDLALAKLDACVHCGLCLPACPTYAVTGSEAESPRGRLYLMKGFLNDAETSAAYTAEAIAPHINQCLGCQACETVCPSGVQYHTVLATTRTRLQAEHRVWDVRRWFKAFALQRLLPNPLALSAFTMGLTLAQRLGLVALASSQLNPIKPWRRLAQLLPNLSTWQGAALQPGSVIHPQTPNGQSVAVFVGCVMNAWFGRIQQATVKALAAQGYTVVIPPQQTCCGALAHHDGLPNIAQPLAQQNLAAFGANHLPPLTAIIVNAAGCGSTLQAAPQLAVGESASPAQVWPAPVMDIMAFLALHPLVADNQQAQKAIRVAYHAACHLYHAQQVRTQPEAVLAQLSNVTLVPLRDASHCCGSAGVYNAEQPALADEILALKLATINDIEADVLVTGNPGCLMQLEYGLKQAGNPLALAHPVEVVAASYPDSVIARMATL